MTKKKKRLSHSEKMESLGQMSLFDFGMNDEPLDEVVFSLPDETPETQLNEVYSSQVTDGSKPLVTYEDFYFENSSNEHYQSTPREKLADNITALKLIKELIEVNRPANEHEKQILSKYVGWGGFADVFDRNKVQHDNLRMELKNYLTESEYTSARESVLTAYYTDPDLIKSLYKVLENKGFKGGNVLDPSMGTGNFFSAMPKHLQDSSVLTGIELDKLTGAIAKQLFPNRHIFVKGFEEVELEKGMQDLTISNIPFNDFQIRDTRYSKNYLIHEYFIKKAIDVTKEDGWIVLICSTGFLDKKTSSFRQEISDDVRLVGAIRLPNNTFKRIAGTSVTTDVLFLQKTSQPNKDKSWVTSIYDEELEVFINQYYKMNPHHILGTLDTENYFGKTLTVRPHSEINVLASIEQIGNSMDIEFTEPINNQEHGRTSMSSISLDTKPSFLEELNNKHQDTYRKFSYLEYKGELFYYALDGFEKVTLNKTAENRLKGMIQIREAVLKVIHIQRQADYNEERYETARLEFNQLYDTFVSRYGYLSSDVNKRVMNNDDTLYLLMSCENPHPEIKDEYVKADIFLKPTIRPYEEVTSVATAYEALQHSIMKKSRVDLDYMQYLYEKPKEEILIELRGEIFLNPIHFTGDILEGGWEIRDEYLTGDVKTKLSQAYRYVAEFPEFQRNIDALLEVIPQDLEPSQIEYKIGSTWIPTDVYQEFMNEIFELENYWSRKEIEYERITGNWKLTGYGHTSSLIDTQFGTRRKSPFELFQDALNLLDTEVRDRVEWYEGNETKHKYVLNPKETILARQQQTKLQEAFQNWLWKDEVRTQDLLKIYNEQFNRIVPRNYDGSNLVFNGMNEQFELHSHQKNIVSRILFNGRALMAHEVGAGKTASMITAGMMMKDQGMIRKPLYVVPNHLVADFARELYQWYPSKHVLVTSKKDFARANRQQFVSKIAVGDYDAIIIGHSQFSKIPLSIERQQIMLERELETLRDAIAYARQEDGQSFTTKQLVLAEKKLELRIETLLNQETKDDLLTFEELGVDFLFVDEAHNYKNLHTYSKLRNVAGVSNTSSQKATDMLMKTQYLLEEYNNRGVVFATGTPISNSMTEFYTMQRYLQPDVLEQLGLDSFDRWASTFGEITSSLEITPEGGSYQMKTRFSRFYNLPELMNTFNLVADIQTADMLNLDTPEIETGKAQIIALEPNEVQRELMDEFVERAERIRDGGVDPTEDNMLKLTHEAKLMAIDPRLLSRVDDTFMESKISECALRVSQMYHQTSNNSSTQIVFCDSGTPKEDIFNVYDEMKRQMMAHGVEEDKIAFIHDAKTETQRDVMFEKMRKGEIRILLGSTSKLGTGTNVQDKIIALHHLDCPWRPSDLIQRDGRGIRQGNKNKSVSIFRYVTKGTFDSYLWQIQEQKLKYITQVMNGNALTRSCSDLDETVLTASEVKAIATGNPMIKEKMEVDNEVTRLRMAKQAYEASIHQLKVKIFKQYPQDLKFIDDRLRLINLDLESSEYKDYDTFKITLHHTDYTDMQEAGKELRRLVLSDEKITNYSDYVKIGAIAGYELRVKLTPERPILEISNNYTMKKDLSRNITVLDIEKIVDYIKEIPVIKERFEQKAEEIFADIATAKPQLNKPFELEDRLSEMLRRQVEIDFELNKQNQMESESGNEMDNHEYDDYNYDDLEDDWDIEM